MMMFINPMLILTAESVIEKSFEHRNPTLFAIGAGMLGVGTVGWAGTKAFVKKESKARKPMNRTFKTTGGASILVTSAAERRPAAFAPDTRERARSRASSRVFMNAPFPHLTSKTSVPAPSASFFDSIEPVMSGIDATVPVTSLRA